MRIVIKIGSSTLTHPGGRLDIRHTEHLVKVLSDLKNAGHQLVLVSSGAISMGVGKLGLARPADMPTKQAAAAVGQCELMYTYDRLFGIYNHTVAQMLVTQEDFTRPQRLLNLGNTLYRLLELGVLPILNENDSIATEEISVGENDTLSALVAKYVQADLLVLLSDIDGLYTADPRSEPNARLIPLVTDITAELEAQAGGAGSERGTGGMATKLTAARLATAAGVEMVIANGADAEVLYDIAAGRPAGTRFAARPGKEARP